MQDISYTTGSTASQIYHAIRGKVNSIAIAKMLEISYITGSTASSSQS